MQVINDPAADIADKVRLAIAAMPFRHPKLGEQPAGKKEAATEAALRAGSGRYATPATPLMLVP